MKEKDKLKIREQCKNMHPDVAKSIIMVTDMESYIMKKYNIKREEASNLISRAADFNLKDKKDAYRVIDMMVKGRLE